MRLSNRRLSAVLPALFSWAVPQKVLAHGMQPEFARRAVRLSFWAKIIAFRSQAGRKRCCAGMRKTVLQWDPPSGMKIREALSVGPICTLDIRSGSIRVLAKK